MYFEFRREHPAQCGYCGHKDEEAITWVCAECGLEICFNCVRTLPRRVWWANQDNDYCPDCLLRIIKRRRRFY